MLDVNIHVIFLAGSGLQRKMEASRKDTLSVFFLWNVVKKNAFAAHCVHT